MKFSRIFILFVTMSALLLVTACGNSESNTTPNTTNNSATEAAMAQQQESQEAAENLAENTEADAIFTPQEPGADEKCAFCNMVVYHDDHEMGAFTAQLVTADGTHYFFDDVGCMLNFQRTLEAEVAHEWVRDLNTLEWVEYEEAIAVSANILTPMKYGYAFFTGAEDAQAYVDTHQDVEAELLADKAEIDQVSKERWEKKMKKMQESQMNQDNSEHGTDDHGEHQQEEKQDDQDHSGH